MTDYSKLPAHMRDTARLYVEKGIPGRSFFTALVSNDLVGAFNRADEANTAAMRDWAVWLRWEAPGACWGNQDRVRAWVALGGEAGREGVAA